MYKRQVEETHRNISSQQNEDSGLNHNVYFSPYSQKLSSPINKCSMIDFDTELHKVDYAEFMNITDKLHEAMLRNQKYGVYVAPLLLKMTDYLDGTGSFQDLPSNINDSHNHLLSLMSDWKSMFHDNDLDRDLEFSDKVIKYSTPKRKKNVHLSRTKRLKSNIEINHISQSNFLSKKSCQKRQLNMCSSSVTDAVSTVPMLASGRTQAKKPRFCSFCRNPKCLNIQQCNLFGTYGSVQKCGETLKMFLADEAPFRTIHMDELDCILKNPEWKDVKHLQIKNLMSRNVITSGIRPTIETFLVKVTGINNTGRKVIAFEDVLISLKDVNQYISANTRSKTKYIFMNLLDHSLGEEYHDTPRYIVNHLFSQEKV